MFALLLTSYEELLRKASKAREEAERSRAASKAEAPNAFDWEARQLEEEAGRLEERAAQAQGAEREDSWLQMHHARLCQGFSLLCWMAMHHTAAVCRDSHSALSSLARKPQNTCVAIFFTFTWLDVLGAV